MPKIRKVKVLHFIYGLHVGGAETFIVNAIENLDSDRFSFDFAVQDTNVTHPMLRKMIESGKVKIHSIPRFPRHILSQYKCLKHLVTKNGYNIVHIHINAAVNPVPLFLAKTYNSTSIRFIVHSHSSSNSIGGIFGKFLHLVNSRLLINNNIYKIACSDLAGQWMFGNSGYTVLANAIDTGRYKFSHVSRLKIREEFGINEDAEVIGNVGRFVYAKNHRFMIELFAQYFKSHPNAILLLVGTGPLFEEIKSFTHQLGIGEQVVFTGLRTDIPELLSAMDCFLFPSHFEGLGFVAVEAQSTGLQIVASDTISDIINIRGYVNFLSLKEGLSEWTKAVDIAVRKTRSTSRSLNPVEDSQFDISRMRTQLESIYNI